MAFFIGFVILLVCVMWTVTFGLMIGLIIAAYKGTAFPDEDDFDPPYPLERCTGCNNVLTKPYKSAHANDRHEWCDTLV